MHFQCIPVCIQSRSYLSRGWLRVRMTTGGREVDKGNSDVSDWLTEQPSRRGTARRGRKRRVIDRTRIKCERENETKERETEMATGRVCTPTGSLRCTFWYSIYMRASSRNDVCVCCLSRRRVNKAILNLKCMARQTSILISSLILSIWQWILIY